MELIDIQKVDPTICLDIRYATSNNFLSQSVYSEARCFLRLRVAQRLQSVQKNLKLLGLGLKVFDGYRPHSVQARFWELCPDRNYVADPKLGSKHNRGAAVDVTLVDLKGNELLMPSGFDEFSERAHRSYQDGPKEALENRQVLEEAMTLEGFIPLPHEWWHFDDPEWKDYPILDLSFEELES